MSLKLTSSSVGSAKVMSSEVTGPPFPNANVSGAKDPSASRLRAYPLNFFADTAVSVSLSEMRLKGPASAAEAETAAHPSRMQALADRRAVFTLGRIRFLRQRGP